MTRIKEDNDKTFLLVGEYCCPWVHSCKEIIRRNDYPKIIWCWKHTWWNCNTAEPTYTIYMQLLTGPRNPFELKKSKYLTLGNYHFQSTLAMKCWFWEYGHYSGPQIVEEGLESLSVFTHLSGTGWLTQSLTRLGIEISQSQVTCCRPRLSLLVFYYSWVEGRVVYGTNSNQVGQL